MYVVVWLKIRKHDISLPFTNNLSTVVVWLKIRKHDILHSLKHLLHPVVVWLKIRKHDIQAVNSDGELVLWFD